jgi:hypothetical protein
MGIAAEYLETEDLLIVVWHGSISADEWERFVRDRLAETPDWPVGKRRLADITTLEPSRLSPAVVDTITDLYTDRLHNLVGSRLAIVASPRLGPRPQIRTQHRPTRRNDCRVQRCRSRVRLARDRSDLCP